MLPKWENLEIEWMKNVNGSAHLQNNTTQTFFFFLDTGHDRYKSFQKFFVLLETCPDNPLNTFPIFQMFSVHCSCTHPLLHSSVRRNNEDNTCSFHVFIHCRWTTMNILVIHLPEMAKKERQRKHLYDRIGTPTVSSNLGTPLPPSLALCVSVCVYEYVCVWTGPPCLPCLLHAAFCRLEKVLVVSLKYHFNYRV